MPKRKLTGTIISNKMQKTVVVLVESRKEHPKYKKMVKSHKKYKAHAEEAFLEGDRVVIEECRPLSKEKKWKVTEKITEAKKQEDEAEPKEEE